MCQKSNRLIVPFFAVTVTSFCLIFSWHKSVFELKSDKINEKIIKTYQEQSLQRSELLNSKINDFGYGAIYNALVPEVFCKDLVRIGKVDDGGKWICNPISMLKWSECKIYSLGTSNDPSFEKELQILLNHKCIVRSVDQDEQSENTMKVITEARGVFKKAQIGGERNESANIYTFNNILSEFGDKRIDILKMDIEGGEFEIIDELISTPICQILIEVHGKTAKMTLELLRKLSKNGFYLFSYEINGHFHELCEYSFIHKNCLTLFEVNTVFGKYLR